jgi:glycosyltransferase involved in cell wall biosynthesis
MIFKKPKKMNICIVCDHIFPATGGLGTTTERFAKKLLKRGHKIVMIAGRKPGQKEKIETRDGIKIYRVLSIKFPFTKGYYSQAIPDFFELKQIFKKEKINIIYLVSSSYLAFKTEKCSKEIGMPLVYGLYVQAENFTHPVKLNLSIFRFLTKQLWLKNICNKSCEIITTTKFSKKLAKEYGVDRKIHAISCGIDFSEFNPGKISDIPFREKYNLKNKKYFLFVGRLMKEKNLSLLIKASSLINWKENPQLKIVIVGEGPDTEELKFLARDLNVEKHIIFTGRIDDGLLKSAYKGCEALVHPSLVELEGLTVLEAMAFGKPILIANSKTSASPKFVKSNGFLIHPDNPKDLARKITFLMNNNKILEKFGRKSFKKIKRYSIEKSIDKIEKVLIRNIKNNKNAKKQEGFSLF